MKLKILLETCNVGEKLLDLKSETEKSLVDLFKSKNICGYIGVSSELTKKFQSQIFKQIADNLIFLPAFTVTQTSDNSTFYILKSIVHSENSIVLKEQYGFTKDGRLLAPKPKIYETIYMEGIFGFEVDKNGSCRKIDKAYIKVINCFDKALFTIKINKKNNEVVIYPQLPPRYYVDAYFDRIEHIDKIIKPSTVNVGIPLSSSVTKGVRSL